MSTTYPVPGSEGDYPAARYPDLKLRVVPNESIGDLWPDLGELVQEFVEVGKPYGASIELDTSDRTRDDELRGGASPMGVLSVVVLEGAAAAVVEQLVTAGVNWVKRHRGDAVEEDRRVTVRIYGERGEILREVRVPDRADP